MLIPFHNPPPLKPFVGEVFERRGDGGREEEEEGEGEEEKRGGVHLFCVLWIPKARGGRRDVDERKGKKKRRKKKEKQEKL